MKRILIATLLAASTLSFAGAAMAADNGNAQDLGRASTLATQFTGNSSGSFAARQAAMYNQDSGE
ncbi:MAG TPA: hypothetical protein VGM87_15100 [Roseomonas sp.]|jgi:hypothetical protein